MNLLRDPDPYEVEYRRRFEVLAPIAETLNVPAEEAEELINDVIVSSLFRRHIEDIDVWLAGAFTYAVSHRGGQPAC